MADDGELLDVVDETGEPVGTAPRREVHEQGLLHLAVHVLLVRDGALLVQRRSERKRTYPGKWTSSASGHVPSGENVGEAARREVVEELGIEPPRLEPLEVVRVEDPTVGEREITHVFAGSLPQAREVETRPDPREVSEVSWENVRTIASSIRDDPDRWARSFASVFKQVEPQLLAREEGT